MLNMIKDIRWKWHLSCLEKMIKENKNLETTDKFKHHLRKFQNLNNTYYRKQKKES